MVKRLLSATTEQMREMDRIAVYQYGLKMLQMMENTGRLLARLCRLLLDGEVSGRKILVLAGGGNNGGGGLAAARNLHNWGATVSIALATDVDSLKRSATTQLHILESMGVKPTETSDLNLARINKFDLIIDSLIGYGLQGDPTGEFARAIKLANRAKKPVVSLDVPSGLDATTGRPYEPSIMAAATLALALPKTGLIEDQAPQYVGELWLGDIGIPPEIYSQLGLQGDNPFIDDDLVLLRRREKAAA